MTAWLRMKLWWRMRRLGRRITREQRYVNSVLRNL